MAKKGKGKGKGGCRSLAALGCMLALSGCAAADAYAVKNPDAANVVAIGKVVETCLDDLLAGVILENNAGAIAVDALNCAIGVLGGFANVDKATENTARSEVEHQVTGRLATRARTLSKSLEATSSADVTRKAEHAE